MLKRQTIRFDKLLKETMEEVCQEELSKIPPREELEKQIQLSDEFKMKMNQLIEKAEQQQKRKSTLRLWKRVAVVTLVCVGVAGTLSLTDKEVGAKLKQLISESQDTYVDVEIDSAGMNQNVKNYHIEYLPEGYVTYEKLPVIEYKNSIKYIYKNQEGICLYISIIASNYKVNMDNEYQTKQDVTVNGNPAEFYESTNLESKSHLIYENKDEKIVIQIDGNAPKEEMIKVAENIRQN